MAMPESLQRRRERDGGVGFVDSVLPPQKCNNKENGYGD